VKLLDVFKTVAIWCRHCYQQWQISYQLHFQTIKH